MSYSSVQSNKCSSDQGVQTQTATTKPQATSSATIEDPWAGFYKKSLENRQHQINGVFPQAPKKEELGNHMADHMIENCIGTFGLPLGLGLNFKVNGKELVVPMATEEPSVIAAVSGAAKIISQHGGFTSSYSGNIMVCQVQLLEVPNIDHAVKVILGKEMEIIEHGNMHVSESMRKRGGGVVKIIPRIIAYDKNQYFNIHEVDGASAPILQPSAALMQNDRNQLTKNKVVEEKEAKEASKEEKEFMLIINIHVDVCEAMGANIINTVAEGLSPFLVKLVGGRVGLQIISNYAVERRAIATFRIPVSKLAYKDKSGEEVARGILEGYAMACADSYRAVTHNKGIMNGIDAAAIALGQDFRAIESGAHAWAARTGSYQPLTHYRLVRQGDELMFEGTLELPVPIGTRGGAVQSHPTVKYTHQLMQNPDCSTLGGVLVSVGLAQNFAALRAMASEGIQRGHMSLHSKNIAIQANVPHELVGEVSTFLVASGVIASQAAHDYMAALKVLQKYSKESIKSALPSTPRAASPSSLYASIKVRDVPVSVLVLCDTYASMPTHLTVKPIIGNLPPIQPAVLGSKHTSQWLSNFLLVAQNLSVRDEARVNPEKEAEQLRIQLLSVLLQLLTFQLLHTSPIAARDLVMSMVKDATTPAGLTSQEKLSIFFSEFSEKSKQNTQCWKSKISSFFHPDGIMLDPFFEENSEVSAEPGQQQQQEENSGADVDADLSSKLSSFFHQDGLMLDPFFENAVEMTPEAERAASLPTSKSVVVPKEDQGRVFAFKLGAPLLLSLWWSLQHYIDQSVQHKALAQSLKIEQLKAMASLARSVGFYEVMPQNLSEFMETHASRLMLPFWLSSETLSIDPQSLNPKSLKHLADLGHVLAWRATMLEDLESFNSEHANQLNNSYLLWLHLNGKAHEGQVTVQQFQAELEGLLSQKQNQLLSSSPSFIDTQALLSPERLSVVRQMIKEIVATTDTIAVPVKSKL